MKKRRILLMAGCRKHQAYRFPKVTEIRRWTYPLRLCQYLAEDAARRVEASRKLFRRQFFRGDCHSHTQHSDGCGTVAETAEMVKAAGLDFQYVTDHCGVTQAPECRQHGLWVGQEPGTQLHHMGILGLKEAFTPKMDLLADLAEARRRGAVVFVPHPTGWWPRRVYDEEQKKILEKIPSPFLMEICNGANNIVTAFDYTDDSAVKIWDKLLTLGRVVHALGNTDAHTPHGIGIVWNGVYARRCNQKAILGSLTKGASFVSNGPLIHIAMGGVGMGRRLRGGRRPLLNLTAVDSRGLTRVRVVGDGKVLATWLLDEAVEFRRRVKVPSRIRRYVRVEVRSSDGARGFSNPIYLA